LIEKERLDMRDRFRERYDEIMGGLENPGVERMDEGVVGDLYEWVKEYAMQFIIKMGHRTDSKINHLFHNKSELPPKISIHDICTMIEDGEIDQADEAFDLWVDRTRRYFNYDMKTPRFFQDMYVPIRSDTDLLREFQQWRMDWINIFGHMIERSKKKLHARFPMLYK
jgi:hypothetical protein